MADLRAAREAAFWDHWRKSLRDNPRNGLPAFLDELERLDDKHVRQVAYVAELEAEIARLRAELEYAHGGPPPDPEEPRPRRRTTRKAAGT